jgi:hypothetical protein
VTSFDVIASGGESGDYTAPSCPCGRLLPAGWSGTLCPDCESRTMDIPVPPPARCPTCTGPLPIAPTPSSDVTMPTGRIDMAGMFGAAHRRPSRYAWRPANRTGRRDPRRPVSRPGIALSLALVVGAVGIAGYAQSRVDAASPTPPSTPPAYSTPIDTGDDLVIRPAAREEAR